MFGIVHVELEHKSVELGFGQGIGALLLDGILGGEDQKGKIEIVGRTAGGDAIFSHGLQESSLSLGRGSVDLVCQKKVRKNGTLEEFKMSFSSGLIFFEDVR